MRRVIGLALLLLVPSPGRGAEARDCRDETPLPPGVQLIAPGAAVSPDAARFAGAWVGAWKEAGSDTLCATLVVEEVLPTGHARVVHSRGPWEPLGFRLPMYWRASGHGVDGALQFSLPTYDRPLMAYRFTGDALAGTFRGGGYHALARVPDLAGIGCLSFPLPNGVTSFRFTDANPGAPDVEGLILAGEAVRPLCTPALPAVTGAPPAPLDAGALRAALTGQTFQSGGARLTFDRRGFIVGETRSDYDVGRWEVTEDGQSCRTWTVWDHGRRRCYRVYPAADGLELQAVDRWSVLKLRRLAGP